MKHLTVDEMIEFVSLTETSEEADKILSKVNGHICRCSACLQKVRAFQMIYDEFMSSGNNPNFREYMLKELKDNEIDNEIGFLKKDGNSDAECQ